MRYGAPIVSGGPAVRAGAEDALVTRPEYDPVVTTLRGGADVLAALMAGARIGEAAAGQDEDVLAPLFSTLLAAAAVADIENGDQQ